MSSTGFNKSHYDAGKLSLGAKLPGKGMQTSRTTTNLFKGSYSLEHDPVIKQRLSVMSNGSKTREDCL